MKKSTIFLLNLLALGINVFPVFAMRQSKMTPQEIYKARVHGVKAGIANGFLMGLAGVGLLNSTASEVGQLQKKSDSLSHNNPTYAGTCKQKNNKVGSGIVQFMAFNAFMPKAADLYVRHFSYLEKYEIHGAGQKRKVMECWSFWTGAAVSSVIIAGAASGAIMSLCQPDKVDEANSMKNFGKTILPVFGLVTSLKYLGHYVYKAVGL